MKNIFIILLCLASFYTKAQQTISDWGHKKNYSSNPKKFIKAGQKIFFTASTPAHGQELWVTEGTEESTKLVKDIMIGENSSLLVGVASDYTLATHDYLSNYAVTDNGIFYFVASDNPNEPPKVWETDGSAIGTKQINNKVRGQLHYTGDELIEYVLQEDDNQLKIYSQNAKKDTILALKSKLNSLSRTVVRRGNFLFLISREYPQKDVIIVDLKKRIITGQFSSFYYYGDLAFSDIWKNEIYYTKSGTNSQNNKYASELWRFNINTNKQDSLLSFDDEKISMMATPKEFFAIFRSDGTYSIKNNGDLPVKDNSFENFYSNRFQYDSSDDVLYTYQEEYSGAFTGIKGVRLSDRKLVKNLSFRGTSIMSIISPTKIVIRKENKETLFDINQEQNITYSTAINSRELIIDQEKALTLLATYSLKDSTQDNELFIFDHKKEDFTLLKNINIDGIKSPQISSTTFTDRLITVYHHEKGVMLAVSDGTKEGTKDLRLLVPRNIIGKLYPVSFIENNQQLGIVFQADDSVYCFSLNKKLTNCLLLFKKRKTEYSFNEMPIGLTSLTPIFKDWYQINAFDSDYIITDLTPQNTVIFKQKSYFVYAQSNYMILAEYNIQTSEKYLMRYDFLTKKYAMLSNSINYLDSKIFEDKLYYRSKSTNIWYVTTDNIVTQLVDFKNITKIIKHKNETYFLSYENPNESSQGIQKSLFFIYRLNNNRPQLIISDFIFSRYGLNDTDLTFSEFSLKGKKYLLVGGAFDEISNIRLFKIYTADTDGNLQKVSEFTLPLYSKWFEILKDGIVFREATTNKTILSIMQENFSVKEIFQLANNENLITSEYSKMNVKRFYYSTLGNLFVTDGSLEGSKKLTTGTPINLRFINSSSFNYQFILDSEETNFYFSISPMSLWKTDGTAKGTIQLTNDSSSKAYSLNNQSLALGVLGNKFIFKKPNFITGNFEIWTTEGTVETTQKLLDSKGNAIVNPISSYLWNSSIKKMGNKLYFSNQTPDTGFEPWQTDGTPEGTKMLGDLVKGTQSSDPYQFIEINQNPYCIATETNKALQLWSFCDLKATILAENNLPLNSEDVKLISNQNPDWKYQWLWGGKAIDKANFATFTAQYSGIYQVKIENKIGCINVSDSIEIKFIQKVLANEPLTDDFNLKIFPNPTQNELNLTFEGKGKELFQLSIYDLTGKLLLNQDVNSNTTNTISTQNLNAGMYFIRLSNGEKQSILKVVKE